MTTSTLCWFTNLIWLSKKWYEYYLAKHLFTTWRSCTLITFSDSQSLIASFPRPVSVMAFRTSIRSIARLSPTLPLSASLTPRSFHLTPAYPGTKTKLNFDIYNLMDPGHCLEVSPSQLAPSPAPLNQPPTQQISNSLQPSYSQLAHS